MPIHFRHFARRDIDLPRAITSDAGPLLLARNLVMTGRQGNVKPALIIRTKGSDDTVVLRHDEINLGQGLGTWHVRSDRPRMSGTDINHAFESTS